MEKQKYNIIVLDLDGTLTNRDKVITPRTKEALMEAQRRGKKVVLASGRPTPGVTPLAEELCLQEFGGFILSFNGFTSQFFSEQLFGAVQMSIYGIYILASDLTDFRCSIPFVVMEIYNTAVFCRK